MNQDILVLVEQVRGQVADITYTMLAQARQLMSSGGASSGGKVLALLAGSDAESLSHDLAADEVLYVDHPALKEFNGEAYARLLSETITRQSPRLVLLGDTTVGADVAGWVSARLELPLVSTCRTIQAAGSDWVFTSLVCGCLLYTSPSPRDGLLSRMPSSA